MKHISPILFLIACCPAGTVLSHQLSAISRQPSAVSYRPQQQESDPVQYPDHEGGDFILPREHQEEKKQEEKKPTDKKQEEGKPTESQEEKKPTDKKQEGETKPPATKATAVTATPPQQETKPPETKLVPPLPSQPEPSAPTAPQPQQTAPPQPQEPITEPQTQPSARPGLAQEPTPQAPPQPEGDSTLEELKKVVRAEVEKFANAFSLWKIILAIIVLFAVYLTDKIISLLLERIAARRKVRARWLRRAIPFVSFGLWLFALVIIAGIFVDSSVTVILLLAVAALAVIFASQQMLRDLMGGIAILFEKPFQLGDRIRIGGHSGEVTRIGMRAFQLKAADGSIVVIPNAEVVRQPIANTNPGTMESQVTTELLLPADIRIEEARKVAFEAAAISPYVYINKPIEVQVDEEYRSELLTKIIIKAYVFDAQYENELRSDTIERARKGLQQKGNGSNTQAPAPVRDA
ncbi:MAG: mechanosensitive ion channel [Blastocatellia bacterium]|nr:mechanosensitive ion channel [Blastocatellia bacterium]